MAHKRTGWGYQDRVTQFDNKLPTMQEAYKNSVSDQTLQAWNLISFLKAINDVYTPWANSKGIMGSMRLIYRNYLEQVAKLINEEYDNEALSIKIKTLRYKYEGYNLKEEYLEDLENLAKSIPKTVSDHVSLFAMNEYAKKGAGT